MDTHPHQVRALQETQRSLRGLPCGCRTGPALGVDQLVAQALQGAAEAGTRGRCPTRCSHAGSLTLRLLKPITPQRAGRRRSMFGGGEYPFAVVEVRIVALAQMLAEAEIWRECRLERPMHQVGPLSPLGHLAGACLSAPLMLGGLCSPEAVLQLPTAAHAPVKPPARLRVLPDGAVRGRRARGAQTGNARQLSVITIMEEWFR